MNLNYNQSIIKYILDLTNEKKYIENEKNLLSLEPHILESLNLEILKSEINDEKLDTLSKKMVYILQGYSIDFTDELEVQNYLAGAIKLSESVLIEIYFRFERNLENFLVVAYDDSFPDEVASKIVDLSNKENFITPGNYRNQRIYCTEMLDVERFIYTVSPVVYMDTNIVSNILQLIKSKPNKVINKTIDILKAIDEMDVQVNYSPYVYENAIKYNNNEISKDYFEDNMILVDKYVKNNFEELNNFKILDNKLFSNKYDLIDERKRVSKMFEGYKNNWHQKIIECILIKSVLINKSSKKNTKKKLIELLEYINEKIGVFEEFTYVLMELYFSKNIKNSKFLKYMDDVNKNRLKEITGMSWDIYIFDAISREYFCSENHKKNLSISIPIFTTLDEGLNEIINLNPVKAVIIDKKNKKVLKMHENSQSLINNDIDLLNKYNDPKRKFNGKNMKKNIFKESERVKMEYINKFQNNWS